MHPLYSSQKDTVLVAGAQYWDRARGALVEPDLKLFSPLQPPDLPQKAQLSLLFFPAQTAKKEVLGDKKLSEWLRDEAWFWHCINHVYPAGSWWEKRD